MWWNGRSQPSFLLAEGQGWSTGWPAQCSKCPPSPLPHSRAKRWWLFSVNIHLLVALTWFPPYIMQHNTEPSRALLSLPGEGLLNSAVSPPEISICDFCQGLVNACPLEDLLLCHTILNEKLSFSLSLFLKFKLLNPKGWGSTDNIYLYRQLSLVLKENGSSGYWY